MRSILRPNVWILRQDMVIQYYIHTYMFKICDATARYYKTSPSFGGL